MGGKLQTKRRNNTVHYNISCVLGYQGNAVRQRLVHMSHFRDKETMLKYLTLSGDKTLLMDRGSEKYDKETRRGRFVGELWWSCHGVVMVLCGGCGRVMVELRWSCAGVVGELWWSCYGAVRGLWESYGRIEMELYRGCGGVMVELTWSCTGVVGELWWSCDGVVRGLWESYGGVVMELCGGCGGVMVELS